MMTILSRITVFCIIITLAISSCEKKTEDTKYIIDVFAENKYYDAEIFNESYQGIYGQWKLYDISGGFHGGGHEPNFDFLKINKIGIYGFIESDSLLEYGRIRIDKQLGETLLITFEPDEDSGIFMHDAEKYVHFYGNDTLLLASPCCDRYNYHFIRD